MKYTKIKLVERLEDKELVDSRYQIEVSYEDGDVYEVLLLTLKEFQNLKDEVNKIDLKQSK